MRKILLGACLVAAAFSRALGQSLNDGSLRSGNANLAPLQFLDGQQIYSKINIRDVAILFIEGDINWVNSYYGDSTKDKSLIKVYLGEDRNKGAIFYFTDKKVKKIKAKKIKTYLNSDSTLIKINNEPLSFINRKDISSLKSRKIYLINNFVLKKVSDGNYDKFNLIIVE